MLKACLAALAVTALGACATTSATAQSAPVLTGTEVQLQRLSRTYSSTASEDWGRGTFGRREFSFDGGNWTLRFTLALDPQFTKPVFQFRTQGTYQVLDPSTAVPGAYEAVFLEDKKYVTLLTPDAQLTQAFGLAGCGLAEGVEKDISVTGCALWKPVSICSEDHDLLALDAAGRLFFGVRPADNDMCTPDKRPTAPLPAVVKS